MKKGFVLILAGFMVFLLTACDSGEHIKLTQEESDAIAQYSAYLIMKYDNNKSHKEKLLDEKQLKEAYEERAAEEEENNPVKEDPTPTPSPVPTETVNPEQTAPETAEPTATPEPKPVFESISECYNNKFEVLFVESTSGKSYKGDDEYLSVYAPDGQKMVVAKFSIRNDSSQDQVFATKNFNTSYKLISDKNTYKPKMSLITNDLLLLEKKLAPGESTSGILVYFIDEEDTPMSIIVTNTDISPDKIYEITINH
ncbi:MAG: DUF4352 domain-containing protein [Lachnospiraceae bacterium]|nr:DUF4352 domain-containing protein [Lachnospiraceae bacterium]